MLLKKEFSGWVDKIYIYPCINLGGGVLDMIKDGVVKKDSLEPGSNIPCDMLFNRLHITCEGYLNACCADINNYLALEDLHYISLADAWNSERMMELRRQHLSGCLSNNMCYQCIYNIEREVIPINSDLI